MRATGKRIISIFICLMLLFSCTTVWAGEPEAKAAADAQAVQLEIVSSGSVVPGSTVTLKGTAAVTGDPDAVYRYIYYDGITWREIYSSSNPLLQVNWIPSAAGGLSDGLSGHLQRTSDKRISKSACGKSIYAAAGY